MPLILSLLNKLELTLTRIFFFSLMVIIQPQMPLNLDAMLMVDGIKARKEKKVLVFGRASKSALKDTESTE